MKDKHSKLQSKTNCEIRVDL